MTAGERPQKSIMTKIKQFVVRLLPARAVSLVKNAWGGFRAKRLRRTRPRITGRQIVKDLRNLGIKKGSVIFVHSSLKSIGFVEGGAETVIDALMEAVGPEGTLTMPCLSISGSMVETLERGSVFDPQKTPSTVGSIAEVFRKRQDVCRSIHPTHSVCAWGAKAEWITSGHENANTNFGPGTPFHKIMEENGLIVGLGVDFGPVTFVHIIEDTINDFPLQVYCDKEYMVKVIDNDGNKKEMRVKAHDPEVARTRIDKEEGRWIRAFFTERLSAKGFLKTGYVGQAKTWVVSTRDLFETQLELLKEGITVYTTEEQYKSRPGMS
jgi:aminoglycoside 3-N-acetyltransferase